MIIVLIFIALKQHRIYAAVLFIAELLLKNYTNSLENYFSKISM
jgi:hypothetical protein